MYIGTTPGSSTNPQYMRVTAIIDGNINALGPNWYVRREHADIFYSMCANTTMALLYLNHEWFAIRDLAQKIMLHKGPIEVRIDSVSQS